MPSGTESPPRRGRVLLYVLGFCCGLGYLLATPAGRSHLDHVWAEDGARFLVDALSKPFAVNLVTPYAGYLHLVPRLVAQVVALLPLGSAAAGLAVLAAAIRAGIAVFVFAASGGYLRAWWLRSGLAAGVVVLPAANGEALNNIADLHWFLLFGAFWALLWRPVGRWRTALATTVVFLSVGSSVLALGLLPLALIRGMSRAWRDRVVVVGFGLGAIAQVGAMLTGHPRNDSVRPFNPGQAGLTSLLRGPLMTFTGPDPVPWLVRSFGYWPAALALACVLAIAVAGIRGGVAASRLVVIAALGAAALALFVQLYVNWSPGLRVVRVSERYSTAPCLFLLAALAVGLDAWPRHGRGGSGCSRGSPCRS